MFVGNIEGSMSLFRKILGLGPPPTPREVYDFHKGAKSLEEQIRADLAKHKSNPSGYEFSNPSHKKRLEHSELRIGTCYKVYTEDRLNPESIYDGQYLGKLLRVHEGDRIHGTSSFVFEKKTLEHYTRYKYEEVDCHSRGGSRRGRTHKKRRNQKKRQSRRR